MFDFFKRRRELRDAQLETLKAVAASLADAARAREAEALRTEAMLAELREQRSRDQEAFLRALTALGEQNAKVIEGVTGAVSAQATALAEHLKLFKTESAPVGRTTRDEDEYRAEVERVGSTLGLPEEELAAILQMEQGLLTDIDLT